MLKKLKYLILAVLCFIFTFFTTTSYIPSVRAETTSCITSITNVLDDLQRSKDFNKEEFEENPLDYSLEVLTLFEGEDGNLFVYVYQPSGDKVKASSINFSKIINNAYEDNNYSLFLVSAENVFFKYAVLDFQIEDTKIRTYEIYSIFRKFNSDLGDSQPDNDNTISEIGYNVGRKFEITGSGNKVFISSVDVETIKIENQFVGFMRYPMNNSIFFAGRDVDFHFVAFSTKHKLDKLKTVELFYNVQDCSYSYNFFDIDEIELVSLGGKNEKKSVLKYDEDFEYKDNNFFSKWSAIGYSFPQIESSASFLETEKNTKIYSSDFLFDKSIESETKNTVKEDIKTCHWVIRFAVTEHYMIADTGLDHVSTLVTDVNIFRLEFEIDGKVYNLGVVSNIQSGGSNPSNVVKVVTELREEIKVILAIVLLLAFIVIFWPLIKLFFKAVFFCFKFILDILFFPIKLLLSVFKR